MRLLFQEVVISFSLGVGRHWNRSVVVSGSDCWFVLLLVFRPLCSLISNGERACMDFLARFPNRDERSPIWWSWCPFSSPVKRRNVPVLSSACSRLFPAVIYNIIAFQMKNLKEAPHNLSLGVHSTLTSPSLFQRERFAVLFYEGTFAQSQIHVTLIQSQESVVMTLGLRDCSSDHGVFILFWVHSSLILHLQCSGVSIFINVTLFVLKFGFDIQLLSPGDILFPHRNFLASWPPICRRSVMFVVNHGMTSSFLDELLHVSRQFFALPLEERLKCSIAGDYFNGYGNGAAITGDKPLNWNDRLFLTVYPEDQRKLQVWPSKPDNFKEVLHEFSVRSRMLLQVFLKAMARSLNIEEDSFLKEHGEGGSIDARFGIYPRCWQPDKVYGVHPHSDRSSLTLLLPDKDVPEGLHIQKHDQWFRVPVIPGALFVNLGDFAEVMSNGIFKSVVHRVVTNSERERFSVAAFCTPEPENEVGPIKELLISTDQPQLYKKVNMKTYKQLFFETYPHGKRVLDALRI